MASVGFSKSGALLKLNAPVDGLIANLDASAPPFNDQVTDELEVNLWTTSEVLKFSLTDLEKVVLPDSPASIILETVTVTVWLEIFPWLSVALTMTT